ncbi:hypothetical protein SAMN05443377_13417 [Propionibacterium cyclohexanicum]|uniref:Uncharacterized protein n=1 Tax=Propionibacterium cyclohexanicum TaxID=64702 RepID=A0A1H9U169_9ACTN|nr:hypothetical protein [Propionibacterium cyclohexanicum]SES03109.1 hypothetical protein SAMN05443377_13417 [Propionibacterium cyclohexanicum]
MLTLTLRHDDGELVARHSAQDTFLALKSYEYVTGDVIELEVDEAPGLYWIQFDEALGERLVYLSEPIVRYEVILDATERRPYSPKIFSGVRHYLSARRASRADALTRRNLALNPYDRRGEVTIYPHASSNLGPAQDTAFRERNAIDGIIANDNHGSFPFQSWGTDRREDARFTLDFGRPVLIDELAFVLRGDYPHDSHWTALTVDFDDCSLDVPLTAELGRQRFTINEITTTSLTLSGLVKNDDDSPFPALTQIEAYGHDVAQPAARPDAPVRHLDLHRLAR